MQKLLLLVLLVVPLVLAATESYKGDKVLTLYIENEAQVEALDRFETDGLDIWTERWGVGAAVDVRVTPKQMEAVSKMMQKLKVNYSVKLESVQAAVDRENEEQAKYPDLDVLLASQNFKNEDFFTKYRTHEEFSKFWEHLHSQFPTLTTLFSIGETLLGKKIFGIKITGKSDKLAKPQMVFNGGQHAREWISPMTIAFIAHSLLSKYDSDAKIKKLVDELEWHLIPIVNIDGYEYTHAGHRMHRKNMRKVAGGCIGVDPNRNWDYQWNATGGSSTNPCSETYRGPFPFSEPESGAIGNYTIGLPNLRGYIDFHSYSQLWMRPWGFTKQAPKDEDRMKKIGDACSKAVKDTHGKNYASGRISIIIYEASGSSADFVYGKRPEATAFGVELRDTGSHGFILPPKEIIPTGEENLNAIAVFGQMVLEKEQN